MKQKILCFLLIFSMLTTSIPIVADEPLEQEKSTLKSWAPNLLSVFMIAYLTKTITETLHLISKDTLAQGVFISLITGGIVYGYVKKHSIKKRIIENKMLKAFPIFPKEEQYSVKAIKSHLDQYVVGQEEVKKFLSISVHDHYAHIAEQMKREEEKLKEEKLKAEKKPTSVVEETSVEDDYSRQKQNLLLLGPTGTGKTYIITKLAERLQVPLVIIDGSKLTPTGVVGPTISQAVSLLLQKAGGNLQLAQYGIIYIDEADKLADGSMNSEGMGFSGNLGAAKTMVQNELLKILEGSKQHYLFEDETSEAVQKHMNMAASSHRYIDTTKVLFILGGAFAGIDKIVLGRMVKEGQITTRQQANQMLSRPDLLSHVTNEDLIQYGYKPELVGRLTVKIALNGHSVDDLKNILTQSKDSPLKQMKDAFKHSQVDLQFSEDAIHCLATHAHTQKIGARGLNTSLERLLRHYRFDLEKFHNKSLLIDTNVIESKLKISCRISNL